MHYLFRFNIQVNGRSEPIYFSKTGLDSILIVSEKPEPLRCYPCWLRADDSNNGKLNDFFFFFKHFIVFLLAIHTVSAMIYLSETYHAAKFNLRHHRGDSKHLITHVCTHFDWTLLS